MKKNTRLIILCILCACIFFGMYSMSHAPSVRQTESKQNESIESPASQEILQVLTADGSTYGYKILLRDTPELRTKGLSGRSSLGTDEVMLFAFERDGRNFFWMKDMLFSIDIVWLDSDKKVIHIERDAKPESFPKSFGPDADSKYVLEFKEGVAESIGLKVGDIINFSLPSSKTKVATKVDTSPLTDFQVTSLILNSAFEKNILSKSPISCFKVDIQNRGILNKDGDPFVYSEIYMNELAADARCILNKEYSFTKEEPLHTAINLKTKEVIIQNPGEFNPCFGISYGECEE